MVLEEAEEEMIKQKVELEKEEEWEESQQRALFEEDEKNWQRTAVSLQLDAAAAAVAALQRVVADRLRPTRRRTDWS